MKAQAIQLWHLGKGKMAKQTGVVYLAQIAQAVVGFATSILLIRHLTVDEYGTFSMFMSVFMLLAGLAHWGWIDTYVRFGSVHLKSENYLPLEAFFRKKIVALATVSALVLAGAAPILAQKAYHRPDWSFYLFAAALTGFFTCIFSFEMNRVRLFQRFWLYSSATAGGSVFRLAGLLVIFALGALHINGVIAIYLLYPLLFTLLLWGIFPPQIRGAAKLNRQVAKESRVFNRWLLVSIFCTTIITNMDLHFLAYFKGSGSVAQLGAASRLTLPITMLVSALTTTLLPRLSQGHANQEFLRFYLRKLKLVLPVLAFGFALAGAAAVPLLSFLAGHKYAGLEGLLVLQLVSILVVLLTNPFGLVLMAKAQTKPLACMNIAQLLLGVCMHITFIPRFGPEGAVCATIGVNTLGFLTVLYLVKRQRLA